MRPVSPYGCAQSPRTDVPSLPRTDVPSLPVRMCPVSPYGCAQSPRTDVPSLPRTDVPSLPRTDVPSLPRTDVPSLPPVSPYGCAQSPPFGRWAAAAVCGQHGPPRRRGNLQATDGRRVVVDGHRWAALGDDRLDCRWALLGSRVTTRHRRAQARGPSCGVMPARGSAGRRPSMHDRQHGHHRRHGQHGQYGRHGQRRPGG